MTDAVSFSLWRRLRYTRLRDALRFRIDGRLDWRLVVATAGLPEDLADKTRQVVRRTRLWRAEKVDVARELVAHFQDGLDAGRSAEQLADFFGDVRQTTRLIRRAKKRGRPLWWQCWRWSLRAFAMLIAFYVLSGIYLLIGRPSISTDYLAQINARAFAVPENERAWPLYREALLAMSGDLGRRTGAGYESSSFALANGARPEDAHWPQVEEFLNDHQPALEKLRQAGERESLGLPVWSTPASFAPEDRPLFAVTSPEEAQIAQREFPDLKDRTLISTLLPHVHLLREASGILQSDCRRAARAGDADIALADVIAQLGISRHVQETPFLVSALVAGATQEIAFSTIQEVLSEHPDLWSNDQLRDLAHAVARAEIDWQRALDGDRAGFYDIVQRAYTDDGNGDGRMTLAGVTMLQDVSILYDAPRIRYQDWLNTDGAAAAELPAANILIASRAEMTALYDKYMSRAVRDLQSPVWEWTDDAEQVLAPLRHSQIDALRYHLVGLLAHSSSNVRGVAEFRRGMRDGVLIGIALELYRREHGDWPESLDELSPHWLPVVPVDRITGGPLRYQVVDGRPLVYSVGVDHDDDGGRLAPGRETRGESPNPVYAGPGFWMGSPATEPANDGDWVLWSTANNTEQEAESKE